MAASLNGRQYAGVAQSSSVYVSKITLSKDNKILFFKPSIKSKNDLHSLFFQPVRRHHYSVPMSLWVLNASKWHQTS